MHYLYLRDYHLAETLPDIMFIVLLHAGRYLSVDSAGELSGKSEAVGQRETWEPVFEEVCLTHTVAHFI